MAASSSGDPGGSFLGRRLPHFMDLTNEFGALTILQLTGVNDTPLPKNPFIIGKSVEVVAGGPIEGANTEAQGTRYTLKVRNPTQMEKLLKMTELIDGTKVAVKPHPNLNISKCVISCFDLINLEENDILDEIKSQGVIRVQRITRNENGNRVNTSALILTFNKVIFPQHVKIGLLRVATRPYFPNPLLCYSCFRFGHPRIRCPGPQRCSNCSNEHQSEQCNADAHCLNCKGTHRPTNRTCPTYLLEKEIIKIKVQENITYPEARKRAVEQQKNSSYAEAAAQQNANVELLKTMEVKMKEKDEQIAKLIESTKRKDDKLKQMFVQIGKMKQQIEDLAQNKPEPIKLPPTSQQAGPSTRSRNNSPAVIPQKRGPKPKRQTAKDTTTSPDRQSPPLKKTSTTTTTNTEEYYSDDDMEITDTYSSQPLR